MFPKFKKTYFSSKKYSITTTQDAQQNVCFYCYILGKYILSSLNRPAIIKKENNIVYLEDWLYKGLYHRINGPSYNNQNTNIKFWYFKGLNQSEQMYWNI